MSIPKMQKQKQNDGRSSYLALKIYLWSLLAFMGSLIFGVGLTVALLGPMAGWLVLVYRIPLTLLLVIVAVCNVVFLIYQLIKHRPSGILWIASIVTIVASVAFIVWASAGMVGEANDQKASEQRFQAADDKIADDYARREEIAKPREVSIDEAKQLLDSCKAFGFDYTNQDGSNNHYNAEGSSTGVLVSEVGEKAMNILFVAQRAENDLVPYAMNAKTRCGGWPQFWSGEIEDLRNESPWGQHAGKVWVP